MISILKLAFQLTKIVIVNHDTSSLVWAHEGKGEDVFKLFFAQLTPHQRNCIEVVTADDAKWIKKVVKRKCKNAVICMDPFHVVSWMNTALDEVRRNEWSEAKKAMDEIKNSRWAVLKNPDNLTDAQTKKLNNIKKKADFHLFKTWEFKEDNNKIKMTVKIGYGFRNFDNFIALLMLRCSPIKPILPFIPAVKSKNKTNKRSA